MKKHKKTQKLKYEPLALVWEHPSGMRSVFTAGPQIDCRSSAGGEKSFPLTRRLPKNRLMAVVEPLRKGIARIKVRPKNFRPQAVVNHLQANGLDIHTLVDCHSNVLYRQKGAAA